MFQNTTDYRKKCILINIYKKIFRKRTFNSMIIFHFTHGNSKSAQCISIGRISHSTPQKTRPHNNFKVCSRLSVSRSSVLSVRLQLMSRY